MSNIISVDTTWEAGTYHEGGFQVADGVTLTIEEGVTVYEAEIVVAGSLIVTGTRFSPVLFDNSVIIASGAHVNVDFASFANAPSVFQLDSVNDLTVENSIFFNNSSVFNDNYGYETYDLNKNVFLGNEKVFQRIRLTGDSVISDNYFIDNEVIFDEGYFFGTTTMRSNNFFGFEELIVSSKLGSGYGTIVFDNNFFIRPEFSELASYVYDGRDDVRYSIIEFSPSESEILHLELKNIQVSAITSTMLPEASPELSVRLDLKLKGIGDIFGYGNDNNNSVIGNNFSNVLRGNGGNDTLDGGSGTDTLDGGSGTDTLDGGSGTDTLDGGSGTDTLTGGEGADTFVFRGVFDHDVITDFDATEDSLEFYSADGSAIAISELIDSTDTNGNHVLSTSDGLSSVTLETINFSSLEISTTVTDRFGSALADADVSAYEIQVGGHVFLREVSTSDTSSVFEIVAKPTEAVSSVDFELLDNAGLIDFQVGSALNGWSIQSNTNTPDVVQLAGFGAINGSQDLVAGQETVLATFTTSTDPDFVIDGIFLNTTAQADISVGEILAVSKTGNVTVHQVARGSDVYLDADKPIDEASEDAIGAYDALQALRLAVGLTKSDGTAEWHDYLAADINKDGRVGADDALDILKFAVGLTDGSSADWIFVDGDADWSGIDRRDTSYDEGIMLEDVLVDTSINMIGILVGDLDGSYVA